MVNTADALTLCIAFWHLLQFTLLFIKFYSFMLLNARHHATCILYSL